MSEVPFRWAVGALLVLGMAVAIRFRGRAAGSYVRHSHFEKGISSRDEGPIVRVGLRVFGILLYGGILVFLVHPSWLDWSRLSLPLAVRWAGVPLGVLGIAWAGWALAHLGRNVTHTVALRDDHELVTSGPYGSVRHPLYLGGSGWIFGVVLLSESALILGAALVTFVFLAVRTGREEAKLEERFGDAWREYARRTGRFFPRLPRRR